MALMMEVEPQCLARTFVEYELLPRLLALLSTAGSNGPPRSWFKFLSENECNLEHLLDEDMPASDALATHLVRDAWHLVRQLQLVSEMGLTQAGRRIAGLQNFQSQVRDAEAPYDVVMPGISTSGQYPIANQVDLADILAQQLRTCYCGQDDIDITSLLQRGAGSAGSYGARLGRVLSRSASGGV